MQLVYMGFTQEAALRCFHFQRVLSQSRLSSLPKSELFTLKADMSLFMRYRIPVQEGPALCFRILTSALEGIEEGADTPLSWAITSEHLSSFASARTTLEEARAARRKPPKVPFKPASSSQLKLPPRIN